MKQGLLYSQIGYDIGDPMKAYFRAETKDALKEAYFEVICLDNGEARSAKPECFGENGRAGGGSLIFQG